jgi:hypothetical protein
MDSDDNIYDDEPQEMNLDDKSDPASSGRGVEVTRQSLLNGHWYKGTRRSNTAFIVGHSILMNFSVKHPNINPKKGFVIKMELSPPDTRHPNVYISSALDADPCSRLAVKASMTLMDGTHHEKYLQDCYEDRLRAPMIGNSIFDWLQGLSGNDRS